MIGLLKCNLSIRSVAGTQTKLFVRVQRLTRDFVLSAILIP